MIKKAFIGLLLILYSLYSCSIMSTAINNNDNKVEIIKEEEKLNGRKFKLISAYPNMNITIEFDDNKIYGFAAVNDYNCEYLTDGEIFSVKNISKTKKTAIKEYTEAENKYLKTLKDATSYKLNGKKLTIYTLLSEENLVFEEF